MTIASHWSLPGEQLDLSAGALLGILNVTPDSFSDGGRYIDPEVAIAHGVRLVREGADIVDVGGESTRPGAQPVPEDEELRRISPVVEGLVAEGVRVSIDTYKPGVAGRALDLGASVINDVSGFRDPAMVALAASSDCAIVAMHMKGTPVDMQVDPRYEDVVEEVEAFLLGLVDQLTAAGVARERITIDPGIGFGKRFSHNLALLSAVERLAGHGLPLLIGTSRKRFLGELIAEDTSEGRDLATSVTTAVAYTAGARLFRVHEVAKSRDALRVAGAIVASQ